jgi:hypothetical protein
MTGGCLFRRGTGVGEGMAMGRVDENKEVGARLTAVEHGAAKVAFVVDKGPRPTT